MTSGHVTRKKGDQEEVDSRDGDSDDRNAQI